jgi:hypothetical protein
LDKLLEEEIMTKFENSGLGRRIMKKLVLVIMILLMLSISGCLVVAGGILTGGMSLGAGVLSAGLSVDKQSKETARVEADHVNEK